MRYAIILITLLFSLISYGQAFPPDGTSTTYTPPVQTAALTTYVATGGSDSNSCENINTPCLTIQGAVDRLHALTGSVLRYPGTVQVLGDWSGYGAYLAGFSFRPATSQGAYLAIRCTLKTPTVASGLTSGTLSPSGAGAFPAWSVTSAGWTPGNLRGLLLSRSDITTSNYLIHDNTADTVQPVSNASSHTGPSFSLLTQANTITDGPVTPIANPGGTTNTSKIGIYVGDMGEASNRTVHIERCRFGSSLAWGLLLESGGIVQVSENRFDTGTAILVNGQTAVRAFRNYYQRSVTSAAFLTYTSFTAPGAYALIQNNAMDGSTSINSRMVDMRYGGKTESLYNSIRSTTDTFNLDSGSILVGTGDLIETHRSGWVYRAGAGVITLTDVTVSDSNATVFGMYGPVYLNLLNGNNKFINPTTQGTLVGASTGARISIASSLTATNFTTELSLDGVTSTIATLRASSPKTIVGDFGTRAQAP